MKKTRKRVFWSIIIVLALFFATLHMSVSFVELDKINDEYDYVLKDTITNNNAVVTDIALLGAHDAFTDELTTRSEADINDSYYNLYNNWFIKTLGCGLLVRLSRAQCASAKEMLYAGVRYFDVRVTKVGDEYYTTHAFLAGELKTYVQDIVDYLGTHNGEYIIFDIQHFYVNGDSINDNSVGNKHEFELLFDYLKTIKNDDNKSIFDYCNYNKSTTRINELTYGEVTNNKQSAGCIVFAKCEFDNLVYQRNEGVQNPSVRSEWHNRNNDDVMIGKINDEMNYIKDNSLNDTRLIINQAQETGFILNETIIESLFKWSLLNMNANLNAKYVADKDQFMDWIEYMPVFMVDNATTNVGEFNKLCNEYIMEYNRTL